MRHKSAALVTAATLVLTFGATAATAAATSGGSSGGVTAGVAAGKKPGPCVPAKPDPRLEHALRDVKTALGANGGKLTDKVVAVFAKDMGMPMAEARQVLKQFFGDGPSGPKPGDPGGKKGQGGDRTGPAAVFTAADLAKALHISQAKAQVALDALQKLAHGPRGTIDENSPAFAAIATAAGVSPRQLDKALFELKMAAGKGDPGGSKPGKGGKGKPVPCKPAKGKPGKPAGGQPGKPGKPAGGDGKDGRSAAGRTPVTV